MPSAPTSHPTLPRRRTLQWLAALAGASAAARGHAAWAADASQEPAECIAPSRPGGGFDLTCGLATQAVQAVRPTRPRLQTRYLPGGIGAMAFDQIATGRLGGPGTLVAFSSGSLLNIAQGRFGPHPVSAVRWIATLGTDYGVVAVHRDSPHQRLQDVVDALRKDPARVVFGAGGTLGSQDWMKAALLTRAAGQDPKRMRFVSFEGGGEALKALRGGHIGVFTGDAAEARQALDKGAPCAFWPCWPRPACPAPWPTCPQRVSKAWTWSGPRCAACTWPPARPMPPCAPGWQHLPKPWPRPATPRCAASTACTRLHAPALRWRSLCNAAWPTTGNWRRSWACGPGRAEAAIGCGP